MLKLLLPTVQGEHLEDLAEMEPALALRRTGLAETGNRGGHPCGLNKANRDIASRMCLAGKENCD